MTDEAGERLGAGGPRRLGEGERAYSAFWVVPKEEDSSRVYWFHFQMTGSRNGKAKIDAGNADLMAQLTTLLEAELPTLPLEKPTYFPFRPEAVVTWWGHDAKLVALRRTQRQALIDELQRYAVSVGVTSRGETLAANNIIGEYISARNTPDPEAARQAIEKLVADAHYGGSVDKVLKAAWQRAKDKKQGGPAEETVTVRSTSELDKWFNHTQIAVQGSQETDKQIEVKDVAEHSESPVTVFPAANGSVTYRGVKFNVSFRGGGSFDQAAVLMDDFIKAHESGKALIDGACLADRSKGPDPASTRPSERPADRPAPANTSHQDGAKVREGSDKSEKIVKVVRLYDEKKGVEFTGLYTMFGQAIGEFPTYRLVGDGDLQDALDALTDRQWRKAKVGAAMSCSLTAHFVDSEKMNAKGKPYHNLVDLSR